MKIKSTARAILILLGLITAGHVWAQSGGGYNLGWSSIDGGGTVSISGEFMLHGTIGQADADTLSGGGYVLAGGFLGRPVSSGVLISPPNSAPPRNYFMIHQATVTWNQVSGAIAYQIQVSRNTAFTDIVYTSPELSADTLFMLTPALDNNTYYWRVRSKDNRGKWGSWSVYDSFVVNAP